MNDLNWFHRIKLPDGTVTPGICDHGTGEDVERRFGLQKDLSGKTVLDIGCRDGLFSIEAKTRGADVTAVDVQKYHTFDIAMLNLDLKIPFHIVDIQEKTYQKQADITFFFGVLYHVKSPLLALENLFNLTKEYSLIETAITYDRTGWRFMPGHDNDPTNFWYPHPDALNEILLHVGYKKVEVIWFDDLRRSVKAIK